MCIFSCLVIILKHNFTVNSLYVLAPQGSQIAIHWIIVLAGDLAATSGSIILWTVPPNNDLGNYDDYDDDGDDDGGDGDDDDDFTPTYISLLLSK